MQLEIVSASPFPVSIRDVFDPSSSPNILFNPRSAASGGRAAAFKLVCLLLPLARLLCGIALARGWQTGLLAVPGVRGVRQREAGIEPGGAGAQNYFA